MSSSRGWRKTNFANTCNLLSQYIKEKSGSLKDFNFEIDGKIESLESIVKAGSSHAASSSSAMKLLTQMENSSQTSKEQQRSADSFINIVEDTSNKASTSKDATPMMDLKSPQLTIFYAGSVLVVDDCPTDRAKKLMQFASGGISSNTLQEKTSPVTAVDSTFTTPRESLPPKPSFQNGCGILPNTCKANSNNGVRVGSGAVGSSSRVEERTPPQPEVDVSDLPIARRSSVHRFLEKRKDRAAARGPYQIQDHPGGSPSSRGQLDLNL